jgi:DNA-binding NarL/FixJ family response regulator
LRASVPETHVLILSGHTEPSWVRAAFAAGACGYVAKSSSMKEIEVAVREVLQGRFYISPVVAAAAFQPALLRRESAPPAVVEPFTPREIDIATGRSPASSACR